MDKGRGRQVSGRLAYSIKRLSHETDVGRTMIYAEIAAGRLVASKIGRHTIITRTNALRWLRDLRTSGFDKSQTDGNVDAHDDDVNANANDNDNNDNCGLYVISRRR